ncbi:hypothetical protein BJ944DRAFT_240779 [Cunninghamella echinulata]|nr:hypothetical protein BJ944DRAFT_240779 [Cunninghamella echinulata]
MTPFLSILTDKINNHKKNSSFLFEQSRLDYYKIKIEYVTNFKEFFKEDMPVYDDFNEQVKEFINCDQVLHADPLTQKKMDWSTMFKYGEPGRVMIDILTLSLYTDEVNAVNELCESLLRLFEYESGYCKYSSDGRISMAPCVSKILKKMHSYKQPKIMNYFNYQKPLIQESRCLFYSHFSYCPSDGDSKYCYPEEIQFMADALTAFQENDSSYRYNMKSNDSFLNFQWIPGVIMIGTRPRFLLMPVTHELLQAVIDGQPPENETIIKVYITPSPTPYFTGNEMKSRDQRLHIAACYKALRKFVIRE